MDCRDVDLSRQRKSGFLSGKFSVGAQCTSKWEGSDYVLGGFGPYSVDAGPHPQVLARYINHHPDAARRNATFVKNKAHLTALVVATRPIERGEELFVDYGAGYWRARGCTPSA